MDKTSSPASARRRTRETVHCTHAGLGRKGDRKDDLAFRLPTSCRYGPKSVPRASLMDGPPGVPSTEHHPNTSVGISTRKTI